MSAFTQMKVLATAMPEEPSATSPVGTGTRREIWALAISLLRHLAATQLELDALRGDLDALQRDRDECRELLSAALSALFSKNSELQGERSKRYELLEQYRALRQTTACQCRTASQTRSRR